MPPADIRERLGLGERETAHKLVRVRSNEEGEPLWRITSAGPSRHQEGLHEDGTWRRTPRLDIIRENGIELTKVEQVRLAAENAVGADIAAELGV